VASEHCQHCAGEIPYARGRRITICRLCQLRGHTQPQESCEVCRRLDEIAEEGYGIEARDVIQ
jgi:primosomal protein N'